MIRNFTFGEGDRKITVSRDLDTVQVLGNLTHGYYSAMGESEELTRENGVLLSEGLSGVSEYDIVVFRKEEDNILRRYTLSFNINEISIKEERML